MRAGCEGGHEGIFSHTEACLKLQKSCRVTPEHTIAEARHGSVRHHHVDDPAPDRDAPGECGVLPHCHQHILKQRHQRQHTEQENNIDRDIHQPQRYADRLKQVDGKHGEDHRDDGAGRLAHKKQDELDEKKHPPFQLSLV